MLNLIFRVERWKWNDEFSLWVSTEGHFKDKKKRPIGVKIDREGGYVFVPCLCNNETIWKPAHRVVMFTWKPTANMECLTVDHLDHNKRNNSVTNLEWVTKEENYKRAWDDFIVVDRFGKEQPRSKKEAEELFDPYPFKAVNDQKHKEFVFKDEDGFKRFCEKYGKNFKAWQPCVKEMVRYNRHPKKFMGEKGWRFEKV